MITCTIIMLDQFDGPVRCPLISDAAWQNLLGRPDSAVPVPGRWQAGKMPALLLGTIDGCWARGPGGRYTRPTILHIEARLHV